MAKIVLSGVIHSLMLMFFSDINIRRIPFHNGRIRMLNRQKTGLVKDISRPDVQNRLQMEIKLLMYKLSLQITHLCQPQNNICQH